LPELTRVFAASPDQTQGTLSAFLLGFSVGQLVCGPLADRHGRKPLLLIGLVLYSLGGIGCAVSPSLNWLFAGRFLQGVGACAGPILSRTIVRDLFDRRQGARMLSHMMVVMSAAPLLAPILGGYLLDFISWRAIFLVLATAGLALLAAVARFLGESLARPDPHALKPRRILSNYRVFLLNRSTLGFTAVSCLLLGGLFSYIAGAPFVYIEVFGVRSDAFGYFFALPAAALIGGGIANAALLRHWDGERLVQFGLVLVLAAGLAMFASARWGAGVFGVALPITLYVFGFSLITPNALAAAMEPHRGMAGIVSSLIGCLQMAGSALAIWAAGAFYDHTPAPMATSVLALGGAAFVVYHLLVRTRPGRFPTLAGASSETR
jgi:DHA1 family bicyclomycin/chloramphenicol resistance-like MFS transporter